MKVTWMQAMGSAVILGAITGLCGWKIVLAVALLGAWFRASAARER